MTYKLRGQGERKFSFKILKQYHNYWRWNAKFTSVMWIKNNKIMSIKLFGKRSIKQKSFSLYMVTDIFLLFTFWRNIYIIHQWLKLKGIKSQNGRNKGFSYYLCLMMKGSGSVPPTNEAGSGSGRPKNLRILRIRNNDLNSSKNTRNIHRGTDFGRCRHCRL